MTKSDLDRGALMAAIFAVVIAGSAVLQMITSGIEAQKISRWPHAEGRIDDARLHYHSGKHGAGYSTELSYSYSVAGRPYLGTRISAGVSAGDRLRLESEAVARRALPSLGSAIRVRYDPQQPNRSVLHVVEPGAADYITLGLLLAVIGVSVVAGLKLCLRLFGHAPQA